MTAPVQHPASNSTARKRGQATPLEIAVMRVESFLFERGQMRGLDAEHITSANWSPLNTSDLQLLIDASRGVL